MRKGIRQANKRVKNRWKGTWHDGDLSLQTRLTFFASQFLFWRNSCRRAVTLYCTAFTFHRWHENRFQLTCDSTSGFNWQPKITPSIRHLLARFLVSLTGDFNAMRNAIENIASHFYRTRTRKEKFYQQFFFSLFREILSRPYMNWVLGWSKFKEFTSVVELTPELKRVCANQPNR